MAETITHSPIESEEALALRADALRAEAWAGEPFLRPDEDPDVVLAAGTARRRALDDALAELESGRDAPSPEWRVRYALLLGLERVLSEKPPRLASGTELRRHQVDALAGMLTELIAAAQKGAENGNGNGNGHAEDVADEDDDADDELGLAAEAEADEDEEPAAVANDPGAVRRYRFRHPTASGKTIAAAGFVEAARTEGVLILTHRRLLVDQFRRELTDHGYGARFHDAILEGHNAPRPSNPITIQTYAWFARHVDEIAHDAYQLVICDEAHTALGEKTSTAIRHLSEPIYIGMTATEELIAKQVSDVFPASVDDLPLADAARRGLIAPLRCLRVPPVAAINQVPIVGGDFEERALAQALDHEALNMAAATLYRERFGDTPGIVYAAGVDHAYNLATAFRAAGIKAEAVSGRTPPVKLAEILAAYERARDRRADQRDAARRRLELAARDRRHAPRADRVEARLPAAHRPDHAHPPAQGSGHRRRLHAEGRDAQRARRLAALAARRGLLPRGCARHARAAPPHAAPRTAQADAGAVARAGHARRRCAARW